MVKGPKNRLDSAEEAEKLVSDLSEKGLERAGVLDALRFVISVSVRRISKYHTRNSERLAWSRVLCRAAAAAGPVLRDLDIADLVVRVERLEQEVKNKR